MKIEKRNISIIILFLFIALSIYLISAGSMLAPDEYNYSHIAWTDHKLSSFSDIVTSQISMYEKWTGRIPVHSIIQVILYLGIWIYNLINPIIFIIFILLITNMIFKKISYFKTITALLLICFFTKGLGEKYIWLSASINYLWTTAASLSIMYLYYKIFEKDEKLENYQKPLLLVLSFFVGWSQENVAFVLGSYIIVIGLSNIKKFIKYSIKEKILIISSIILFGIGSLLLIFAPVNFARMDVSQTKLQLDNIIERVMEIKYLIVIYIITLISIIFIKKDDKTKIYKNQILFLLSIIIGIMPMTIISEFPMRSMLPYEVMIIILIIANVQWIINNYNLKKLVNAISIVISIPVIYMLVRNISYSEKYMRPYKEKIEQEINLAYITNQTDVVLSKFEDSGYLQSRIAKFLIDSSPQTFSTNLINTYMATYYGFDSIQAIKDNEYLINIKLKEEVKNTTYNLIDNNNNIVATSLIDNTLVNTNKIQFIISKEDLNNIKIDLSEEIKTKIQKIELKSVLKTEDVQPSSVIK